jgi:hypothetical protein
MNTKQVAMNWGLVFDGLLFKTFNACGRYKGTETAKRPQWLKDHPNDFTRLADMLVKAETDVATDVIEQEVDSISNVPCPGQPDPDKAHGDAQLAQTPLRASPLPGQPVAARGRPEAADQHFRVPTPTQMITMGTDQTATSETNGSSPDTTQRGATSHTRGPSGGRRRKKQKSSAGTSKSAPKLSPERMRIVVESLQECATYELAAWKAGIHRKTLAYWLSRSKAGDDGYELLVWDDISDRFHVLCEVAIETAHDSLDERVLEMGLGVKYPGTEAYTIPPKPKMLGLYLARKLPEKYGKRRKVKAAHHNPVLVVGQPGKKREYNTEASVKARQLKSLSKKIENLTD